MKQSSHTFYRRNLPHWHPVGRSFFLTWRLYGSLPQFVINQLRIVRQRLRNRPDSSEAKVRDYKRLFARVDSILDRATDGPVWLGLNEIASLIQQTLLERYAHLDILWAYVVMANHVHVFLKPKRGFSVEEITKHIKGYTAREANRFLAAPGRNSGKTNHLITGLVTRKSSFE